MLYNIKSKAAQNISGKSFNLNSTYTFIPYTSNHNKSTSGKTTLSPAYIFEPQKAKGTILFFHPGLHSDFSPRWDSILMNLVQSGYRVIAPNYPMSFGYGKKYSKSSFKEAVFDLQNWKKYILDKYKPQKLFYMSASSGNLLMETNLKIDQTDINGAVSLFGLAQNSRPRFTIPALYVLGINDPKVNFYTRKNSLLQPNITLLSFVDEGHWLRKRKNIEKAVRSILDFFETN